MSRGAYVHFSDTYHRPAAQGGDTTRPLCWRGTRLGWAPELVTKFAVDVTCHLCRSRLQEQPA